jgi:hypothetical protein
MGERYVETTMYQRERESESEGEGEGGRGENGSRERGRKGEGKLEGDLGPKGSSLALVGLPAVDDPIIPRTTSTTLDA